jgi:hypothetical protein
VLFLAGNQSFLASICQESISYCKHSRLPLARLLCRGSAMTCLHKDSLANAAAMAVSQKRDPPVLSHWKLADTVACMSQR